MSGEELEIRIQCFADLDYAISRHRVLIMSDQEYLDCVDTASTALVWGLTEKFKSITRIVGLEFIRMEELKKALQ